MTGTPRSTANWPAIEREYRAGKTSVSKIAQKHGISHTAINKRAAKEGWKRKDAKAAENRRAAAISIGEAAAAILEGVEPGAEQPDTGALGRPTDYRPEYVDVVKKLCELAATDDEIADFFNVDRVTLYRWKLKHEDFCNAMKNGKLVSDERVERSMYQKGVGYYVTEEQAVKIKTGQYEEKVEIVQVQRYVPPDTTAQIFWLKNRRKDEWRDRREVEVGGPGEFDRMSDDELRGFIASRTDPNGSSHPRTRKSH